MSSKREEERNEKIIRGLMKLPPNRRCINCNSLGPQYVCINFWTFVCITCSGIHREFTHRVKSVSMSKFTSQEVESLQNGGNQRAKEMFLKDWDFERQRLPSGNNIENIREFIKHVYVDRKYAGGKSSEKPPRDLQGQGRAEAETRRASSYHSYSQSPPYDFQYEERANKKQGFMLKRKPGSDRGMYEGKVSGLYSPGRYSDHMTEEKFTIEGSSSRVSDYSMSSGGDPFRSHPQSPNSLKDSGFSSPTFDSKEIHADGIQQQTGITHREINGDKAAVPNAQRLVPSTTYGASSVAYQNKAAIVPSEKHSISSVDLFQSPAMPSLLDMFQASSTSSASTGNLASTDSSLTSLSFFEENSQNPKDVNLGVTHSEPAPNNVASSNTSLSSLSFFEDIPEKFSTMNIVPAQSESAPNNLVSSHASSMSSLSFFENPQSSSPLNSVAAHSDSVPKDVGWATFDFPEHASTSKIHDGIPMAEHSGTGTSVDKLNSLTASDNTQWPEFLSSTAHGAPPLMSNVQHENLPPALAMASNSQEWRPFNDIDEQASVGHHPDKPSTADHFVASWESEDFNTGISQSTTSFGPVPGLPSRVIDESSAVDHPAISFMGNLHPHFERTTSNPFDIQYDAEFDASNMQFYDMSTLQSALPSTDLPSSFAGAINDSWFLQDAAPPPGGISYMATQAPSSQLPNVQAHGPVASIGGNPFA